MTHNQIDFVAHKENVRHNLATEKETNRHNVADEGYRYGSLAEEARHNKETEAIGNANVILGYSNLSELNRHNAETEDIQRSRTDAQNKADLYNAGTQRLKTNQEYAINSRGNEIRSDANEIAAEGNRIKQQEANTNASKVASGMVKDAADITSKIVPYILPLIP